MIVAAHQPSYLPWLGYLHKIDSADLFVVMDDLQYESQNFQNRNRVKVNNGACWLTVPLVRGTQRDRIDEKLINNDAPPKEHWQHRNWQTIATHYRRAPHFAMYAAELEAVYSRRWERLLDLDLHMMRLMMTWLDIETPLVLASTLSLAGDKTVRILDLCKKVGASTYLSGAGGSTGYLDTELLERADVEVAWQRFSHPTYEQRYPDQGFISHLSAIDLLFNCGPERSRALMAAGAEAPPQQMAAVAAAGGAA